MSEQRRSERALASITAGVVIGVVEVVLAISFAALVFGGYLAQFLPDGIGLFLVAAAITLAILAWRSGARGVVGSLQGAVVAVLAVVATTTALHTFGSSNRAFVTVVAMTMVVTVLTGITFLVIGTFKRGNLIRFVPYPVVGGFLAGAGWLLLKGGVYVASGEEVHLGTIGALVDTETLTHWLPALAFGVILFLAVRLVKRPLVIPIVLAAGLALFAIGMLVTGSSIDDARTGLWMVGPYRSGWLFQPWTYRAVTGADWWAVLGTSRRHRHGGARRRARDPVQRQRSRARAAPGPRHEQGAPRRRPPQRRLRRVRRCPGLPLAQPDGARGAHERRRAGRGARRLARPARRRRVRRGGDRADPAHDRRRRAGVPRPDVHRRVGLG